MVEFKNKKIIFFDGVCNVCSAFLDFVYDKDPKAKFSLTWLQSHEAVTILKALDLYQDEYNSIIYLDNGVPYFKSTAFLKIVRQLKFPWPLLWLGVIVPRWLRNVIYDIIADNRYKWFGKKDKCLVPTGDLQKRFL